MVGLDYVLIQKLLLSLVLGAAVGLERELKKKPLGLKTTIVISVSSCLLTFVSIEASNYYAVAYEKPMDPLRLAAQIISGVGFLGAGAILRRNNDVISGLTTAAMIWAAAGIGITVGAGFYTEAILATVIMLISVEMLSPLLKKIGPKTLRQKEIRLKLEVKRDISLKETFQHVRDLDITIQRVKIKDDQAKECRLVDLVVTIDQTRYTSDVYEDIKYLREVNSIEIELL
ncbi:putative Mg2+ transporter-C (MgtC) family protein [Bacillus mesophilus]|uniref:MgtC/SapB family protein n=1 Tax=Bacillus mesophilus TaxID=1808955 RepID=A0A6M0QC63_9BACI|nr:MgtC/SapB family protein [Bacillus mesophilus]MBM7663169.1 putative Mg2+ transporter-C (MgtC) family protein [Bacillus mesophilus]NEY73857.1 MgtC/SapB family protein [Bacillus mesophilus]